ncbi:MAG TPA: pirin family protein [Fibrobacteria bacterium]|nr:pirin family protein [Fibrobacteria bacterium]HOX51010.1 pirin family protein [Fibrobacteria bacterium]
MWNVRKAEDRGGFEFGWLSTRHTFSFGDYFDDEWMGYSALRVINEDVVAPGTGFGMHGHRHMEIVTWVLSGTLRHQDSLGHGQDLTAGEIQRMSAGTGIRHSESNPSPSEPVHLLQIWIQPDGAPSAPSYEQIRLPEGCMEGRLHPVATPDGREGSARIGQDTVLRAGRLATGQKLSHPLVPGRKTWLQVARGSCLAGGIPLERGDAIFGSEAASLELEATQDCEVLVFDLP